MGYLRHEDNELGRGVGGLFFYFFLVGLLNRVVDVIRNLN